MIYCNYYEAVEEDWGWGPGRKGGGSCTRGGRGKGGGGGSSKKSGKRGEEGEIAANYATMLKFRKLRGLNLDSREEANENVWGGGNLWYGSGEVWIACAPHPPSLPNNRLCTVIEFQT